MTAFTTVLEAIKQKFSLLSSQQSHLRERILAELEFARGFIELPGSIKASRLQKGGWDKLLDRACRVIEKAAQADGSDELPGAIAEAERILAPIGKLAKTYTVHCVGHAHIDMNWMWSWPETVATTNDTFTTMIKLMEEFPDFCFSQSQASVYVIAKEHNPELFAQIQRRVKEGRWEATASHWVEGDKNLASGESLARHLLYTRRFMKENFDLAPEDVAVDWSPDTFGHAWTLPAIDSRGGVKFYYLCRPGLTNRNLPPLFWWESPDGSRLLVNLEKMWYNNRILPHYGPGSVQFWKTTGLKDFMAVYGVGDHGGGPTRRDIIRCHDMDSWPIYPRFILSTARAYYAQVLKHAKNLPVHKGEMNFEFTGCYTSQSLIKKANRLGELYGVESESSAALAWCAAGRDYPAERIRAAWLDVLFNHFHDILPGSGVRGTRDYTAGLFQKVAADTGMIRTQSYRALAAAVDTSFGQPKTPAADIAPSISSTAIGGGVGRDTSFGALSSAGHVADGPRPFVIFNPTFWQRRELISASIWDADTGSRPGELRDKKFRVRFPDGTILPAQTLGHGDYWGHRFVDVAFPLAVDSLGYQACVVEEGEAPEYPAEKGVKCVGNRVGQEFLLRGTLSMENEFLYVEFDRLTGGISKLIDKATERNLADPADPMGVCEYVVERGNGMSAWNLGDVMESQALTVKKLEIVRDGIYQAAVRAEGDIRDSTVSITYTLSAGRRYLQISIQSRWVERGSAEEGMPGLRMRFPMALVDARAKCEIPFGSIERDLNRGEEVPSQRWIDVTGQLAAGVSSGKPPLKNIGGCTVMNDCKYGHSLAGSTLRINLLRSSYNPDPLPEIGDHEICLAVAPHVGELPTSELVRLGAGFNQPLQVISTDAHVGSLPVKAAALSIGPDNVVVSSIKKAEEDDALIIRMYETQGVPARAELKLSRELLGIAKEALEVDFLERPMEKSSAKATKAGISVAVPAFGIVTVKVRLGR